jgi:hypothetical protein
MAIMASPLVLNRLSQIGSASRADDFRLAPFVQLGSILLKSRKSKGTKISRKLILSRLDRCDAPQR